MKDVALSADGAPVHFEVEGDGAPPLVFVHGWSCDRTYWRGQVGHFAQRHRVVAIDLAGHGESGGDRTAWTMPAFGADVVAVIEQLGLDDPVLIGHSMGGDVIVEAHWLCPDESRVWSGSTSTGRSGEPRTEAEIEEFVHPFRDDFVTATRNLVGQMFVPGSDPDLAEGSPPTCRRRRRTSPSTRCITRSPTSGPVLAALAELALRVVAINPDYRPSDVRALGGTASS